jgi:hypothetical protein
MLAAQNRAASALASLRGATQKTIHSIQSNS